VRMGLRHGLTRPCHALPEGRVRLGQAQRQAVLAQAGRQLGRMQGGGKAGQVGSTGWVSAQ
jgi:hypothetical protein